MTVRCGFALGEVPWERELLDVASATVGLTVSRRYVDAEGILRDNANVPDVILASPALRGFSAKAVRALTAANVRVVIIVDSIRPPWLTDAGLPVVERHGMDVAALFDELAEAPSRRTTPVERTVFVGTGGGVGTTTLACAFAAHTPNTRFAEGPGARSAAALLLGAAHPGVRAIGDLDAVDPLASALQDDAHHLIIDGGALAETGTWVEDARMVLVTPATPLGVVRVCSVAEGLSARPSGLVIVLNRVRASAVGSARGGAALRALVERATGIDPLLVPDRTELCDAAWLNGDVRLLREVVVPLSANGAEYHEAA